MQSRHCGSTAQHSRQILLLLLQQVLLLAATLLLTFSTLVDTMPGVDRPTRAGLLCLHAHTHDR
jgi:hypothetical protein